MEVRCKVDAAIADHQKEFALQKAAFDVEINQARAEADLADDLQVGDVNPGLLVQCYRIDL